MTATTEPTTLDLNFDDHGASSYDPSLYRFTSTVAGIDGWAAVTDEQLDYYDHFGFLSIEHAFTPDEVAQAEQGLLNLVTGKHPGYRSVQFEAAARALLPQLTPEQKLDVVRKVYSFVNFEPALRAIALHPRLLDVARRILGEEPALFEDKALLKPPKIGREKPWHQDHAYWNLPLGTKVVTAWIALDAATAENGCLVVIPGSHREGPVVHFRRRDWQICDANVEVGRAVAAPLGSGGVLLFNSFLHHGTPANTSPERRRALQFVYVPASAARISAAERLAVFGSEGKDVTC